MRGNCFGLGTLSDGLKVTKYRIQNNKESASEMAGMVGNFQGIREDSFLRYIDRIVPTKAEIVGTEKVEGRQCVIVKTGLRARPSYFQYVSDYTF